MIPIQCTISGFTGKPATLFSAYDPDSQVLVISAQADYRRERREDCVVLTNETSLPRDALFTEGDMQDAVASFFALQGGLASDGKSPRLVFSDRAQRANPSGAVEQDGFDITGPKYRLAEAITSAQVAALVTCWYAHRRADRVDRAIDLGAALMELEYRIRNGEIVTI